LRLESRKNKEIDRFTVSGKRSRRTPAEKMKTARHRREAGRFISPIRRGMPGVLRLPYALRTSS
jgi:hypothetical protein